MTRTQYTYQSPHGEDKGVNRVTTTTTTLGGRRTSGPRITEIEDEPARRSSLKRSSVTEVTDEVLNRRGSTAERITNKGGVIKKVLSEDEEMEVHRRFTDREDENNIGTSISRVTSTQKSTSPDGSNKKISSSTVRTTETRTTISSPGFNQQKPSEDESAVERKRKTVVRGDSVRALQHKFQQATGNDC